MTLADRRAQLEQAFAQAERELATLIERRHQLAGALLLLRDLEGDTDVTGAAPDSSG